MFSPNPTQKTNVRHRYLIIPAIAALAILCGTGQAFAAEATASAPDSNQAGLGMLLFWHGLVFLLLLAAFGFFLLRKISAYSQANGELYGIIRNLNTSIEKRSDQLRDQAERVRHLLNSTNESILTFSPDGTITFANSHAKLLLGMEEYELIGQHSHNVLKAVDQNRDPYPPGECPVCKMIQSGTAQRFMLLTITRKNGELILISGGTSPIIEDGKLTGVILVFHDVGTSQENELWRRTIFQSAGEAFLVWDGNRTPRDCNPAMLDWLGLASRDELLNNFDKYSTAAIDDDEPQGWLANDFDACDKNGKVSTNWVFRSNTGELVPTKVVLVKIDGPFGASYFASMHDMRTIRAYEAQLDEERRVLRNIVHGAPFVMMICDEHGITKMINDVATEALGLREGDFCHNVWADKEMVDHLCSEASHDIPVVNHPVAVLDHEGRQFDALLSIKAINLENQPVLVIWLQDITEINTLRLQAEASARAKSEFLASMSHEIRTPMNAILGMTHLLLGSGPDKQQHHYLECIRQAGTNLMSILNDILDISKIESGQLEMENQPFEVASAVNNLANLLSVSAAGKKLDLAYYIQPDVPQMLVGDRLRFTQVLNSLASNAIKFTSEGSVSISVLLLENDGYDATLQVDVTDTGIGLTEDQINTLFRPFQQVDSSMTRHFDGVGLGLAISKRMVEMMGGDIWVESEPGVGSTFSFTVTMPLAGDSQNCSCQPVPDTLAGRRVLLLANDSATSEIVAQLLADSQMDCQITGTSQEAMDLLTSGIESGHPYDLVIMDDTKQKHFSQVLAPAIAGLPGGPVPCLLLIPAFNTEFYQNGTTFEDYVHLINKPVSASALYTAIGKILDLEMQIQSQKDQDLSREALSDMSKANVLLVEDNDINQEVALALLADLGIHASLARNGEEAVAMCRENNYDLVFMDVQMPGMDGLTATRMIREIPGRGHDELPILAMTANAMSGDREKSLEAGMNDHICKPIDPQILAAKLVVWLSPAEEVTE